MQGPRLLLLSLIACGLVISGCQKTEETSSNLSPHGYKEQRLADAMRGLTYEKGVVTVDESVAVELDGFGSASRAEEQYREGLRYLYEVNDRVAAIGAFTRSVLIYSDDPRALAGLGRALLYKGRTREALASLESALEIDPNHLEGLILRSQALAMTGAREKAISSWMKVLEVDPRNGEAHSRVAMLHYYNSDFVRAWEHVNQAEALGYGVPPQFRLLLTTGGGLGGLIPTGCGASETPQIGPPVRIDSASSGHANETTMASVDSSSDEAVGGWNDSRAGSYRVGAAVTNDGGQNWTDMLVRAPAGHQSSTEGDPMTAYDQRTGTLWVGGMSWAGNGGVFVAKKRSGEAAFDPSVMTIVSGSIDKGWMAAGAAPGDPSQTRVYVAYNLGCQYSADMGSSWSSVVSLGSGIGFLPRVGPNGELYVAYWDYGSGIWLRRSLNGGVSFDPAIRIATRLDVWGTQDGSRFPGDFRVPPLAALAVNPNNGKLLCVYFDTTGVVGGNSNVDLYFTESTNMGSNWTTPVVINGDGLPPGDQFFPWLEVDQYDRIHLLFYDTRNTNQNDNVYNGMFDAYYSLSCDGGSSWSEHRLTPTSFNSAFAGSFLGDYLGLGVGGENVYPIYLTTQNGEPDMFTNSITVPAPTQFTYHKKIGGVLPGDLN